MKAYCVQVTGCCVILATIPINIGMPPSPVKYPKRGVAIDKNAAIITAVAPRVLGFKSRVSQIAMAIGTIIAIFPITEGTKGVNDYTCYHNSNKYSGKRTSCLKNGKISNSPC